MAVLYSIVLLMCLLLCRGYERIKIYSDNYSFMNVTRNDSYDTIRIDSRTRIGVNYKGFTRVNISLPKEVQAFSFLLTDPNYNIGRYTRKTPFPGVHITVKFDKRRPITGLCELFETLLPCFNVKQCMRRIENSVYDIDLNDAVWTPSYFVPFSVLKPLHITGENWVRYGHIIIPFELLRIENYHTGGCLSSVGNHNDLFSIESEEWYPKTTDVQIRHIYLNLQVGREMELEVNDAFFVPQPLVIPHKNALDRIGSSIDVVFYELTRNGIERFTANKRKILYPEREYDFWWSEVEMHLNGEQLSIESVISARDGTYNPYNDIYDSRAAMVLYLPRGVYVDLAEMQLMYDAGKIPAFISYEDFVDTDAPYEKSSPQLIVFIEEARIYPLPPTLNVNLSIPIHFRGTSRGEKVNVTIPAPAFFAQSPVRDSLIVSYQPKWWEPAFAHREGLNVTLEGVNGSLQRKKVRDMLSLGMVMGCLLIALSSLCRGWQFCCVCCKKERKKKEKRKEKASVKEQN